MTVTIATSASNLTSRYGSATFDFSGAHIRVHYRHLATVVTIHGVVDAVNVERVAECTRRFILARNPLVLDLSGLNSFAAAGISLFYSIHDDCRAAGVEWTLVPNDAVTGLLRDFDAAAMLPVTRSVHEALNHFANVIARRRQLMLPLIKKTA